MKQSLEEIVEQHGGTVLRVCRVIVGVRDAEDTWSQTFLAALRAYPDLPDDASAEAWLVSIAHRTAAGVLTARPAASAPDRIHDFCCACRRAGRRAVHTRRCHWTRDCGVMTQGSR